MNNKTIKYAWYSEKQKEFCGRFFTYSSAKEGSPPVACTEVSSTNKCPLGWDDAAYVGEVYDFVYEHLTNEYRRNKLNSATNPNSFNDSYKFGPYVSNKSFV